MFGIPNPQFLLQPWRSLTQFTEEFFAALTSNAPVEREGPVTIRVPEGQTALRIERSPEPSAAHQWLASRTQQVVQPPPRPDLTVRQQDDRRFQPPTFPQPPPAIRPVQQTIVAPPISQPALLAPPPIPAQPPIPVQPLPVQAPLAPPAGVESPAPLKPPPLPPMPAIPEQPRIPLVLLAGPIDFTGDEPVRFEVAPQVYNPRTRKWITPPAFEIPDLPSTPAFPVGGGTGNVFVGQVQSGTGNSYQVILFENGPDEAGDAEPVTVKIPTIDPSETISPTTWLFNIFQFSDDNGNPVYYAQPPIWTT